MSMHPCTAPTFHLEQQGKLKVMDEKWQKWKPGLLSLVFLFSLFPEGSPPVYSLKKKIDYIFFLPWNLKIYFIFGNKRKEVEFGLWGLFLYRISVTSWNDQSPAFY